MRITDKVLQDMADFYCKTVFDHIPSIRVCFGDQPEMTEDATAGAFTLEKASEYCMDEDELIDAYEYRPEVMAFEGGQEYILTATGIDQSYQDPLNHPIASIQINPSCKKDLRKLVAVLLHELLHYYLWYIGWDYHDNSKQFLDECKRRGFIDNYTRFTWNRRKGWIDSYDYSLMEKYIEMYFEHKNSKDLHKAA